VRPNVPEPKTADLIDLLAWLWDTCAAPVLDALGYLRPDGGTSRRVWWCPVGPFALLPVHAAGRHVDTAPAGVRWSVLDCTVSSYLPTLRSLIAARAQPPARPVQLAAVGAPVRPGMQPPPGMDRELARVCSHIPATPLRGRQATPKRVIAQLQAATWAHLACHASQDLERPEASALWLTGGELTLQALVTGRVTHLELAYLSACETAVAPHLADGRSTWLRP
jgi:hypothetical protein